MKKIFTLVAVALTLAQIGCIKIVSSSDSNNLSENYYQWDTPQFDQSKFTMGNAVIAEQVKSLDIDWTTGQVDVVEDDVAQVTIAEIAKDSLSDSIKMCHWVDRSGQLIIRFKRPGKYKGDLSKHLTVKVPKGTRLNEIEINGISCDVKCFPAQNLDMDLPSGSTSTGKINVHDMKINTISGDVVVNQLACNELDVETISGNITVQGASLGECKIESVSGDVVVNQLAGNELDVQTASGDITVQGVSFGECEVVSVSGDVEFATNGSGHTISTSTISGDVKCKLAAVSDGGVYTIGSGKNAVDIETLSGDITIK